MLQWGPFHPGLQPSSQTPLNLSQVGLQFGPHSCEQFLPYVPEGHACVWTKWCVNVSFFFKLYILVKLFLHFLYMQIHLPLSHLSPWNPASHPFGQDPVTWWHCSPRKQLLQLVLHSRPYLFPSHSIIN